MDDAKMLDAFEEACEHWAAEFGNYGYSYTVWIDDGVPMMKMEASQRISIDSVPNINVHTVADNQQADRFWFQCSLTFPDIPSNIGGYSDSIAYVLNKWADIGKSITALQRWSFNPYDYIEEE